MQEREQQITREAQNRQSMDVGSQRSRVYMLLNTMILASMLAMCGEFVECAFHEGVHALFLFIFAQPGTTILFTIPGGYTTLLCCGGSFDLVQQTIITGSAPIASFALMNLIIFAVQRRVGKDRLLVRFFFWGFVCRSITVSTGYFLGTLFFRGDTYYVAQKLGTLWGIPSLDIGIAFTAFGAIATIVYIFLIYRGVKADLTKYYTDLLGTSGPRYKTLHGLTFVGAAFLALAFIITNRLWVVFINNASWLFFETLVEFREGIEIELLEGIIILGIFGAIILCNKFCSGRLKGNFYVDNLKIFVMILCIILFYTVFPYFIITK
jgi:hypothetical protein